MPNNRINQKKNFFGMLVITWILIFLTIPFFAVTWFKKTELESQLVECEKMCYPSMVLEDGQNYCSCKPQIKSNLP